MPSRLVTQNFSLGAEARSVGRAQEGGASAVRLRQPRYPRLQSHGPEALRPRLAAGLPLTRTSANHMIMCVTAIDARFQTVAVWRMWCSRYFCVREALSSVPFLGPFDARTIPDRRNTSL